MAGLGRKVWGNETLAQPDLQGYLQDQVVMRFANSAARAAAIGAPTEGMVSWLDDVDRLEVHDGTQWRAVPYGAIRGKMWRTGGFSGLLTAGTVYYAMNMEQSRVSGGFTYTDASDVLNVPLDGLYDLEWQGYATGGAAAPGATGVRRTRSGVAAANVANGSWYKGSASVDHQAPFRVDGVPLKAGDSLGLEMIIYGTSGLAYYGITEQTGSHLTATWAAPLAGATPL